MRRRSFIWIICIWDGVLVLVTIAYESIVGIVLNFFQILIKQFWWNYQALTNESWIMWIVYEWRDIFGFRLMTLRVNNINLDSVSSFWKYQWFSQQYRRSMVFNYKQLPTQVWIVFNWQHSWWCSNRVARVAEYVFLCRYLT